MYHGDSRQEDGAADAVMGAVYRQLDQHDLGTDTPFDAEAGLRRLAERMYREDEPGTPRRGNPRAGTPLDITIELDPRRVAVGAPTAGRLIVTNRSRALRRPLNVEVRVGAALATFRLPRLARGASYEAQFTVPTDRRSVITIGPATVTGSGPLGLPRGHAAEPPVAELFVHPVVIALDPLTAGLEPDIEARDACLLRLAIVVDGATASYRDEDEFELAVSIAGSICVRAACDGQDVHLVAASHAVSAASQHLLLDALSRATLADKGLSLASLTSRASREVTGTNVLILVTGSAVPFSELKDAAMSFGPDIKMMAIRVKPDAPPSISRTSNLTILSLRALSDLPVLMHPAGSSEIVRE